MLDRGMPDRTEPETLRRTRRVQGGTKVEHRKVEVDDERAFGTERNDCSI